MFMSKFRKELFENDNLAITLRKICRVMGIKLPRKFKSIADEINNDLVLQLDSVKPGAILFILHDNVRLESYIEKSIENGVKVIFVGKKEFERSGLKIKEYPCILMEDKINQVGELFSQIKLHYNPKTIAINMIQKLL